MLIMHNRPSASGAALKKALGIKRLRGTGPVLRGKVVLNWGTGAVGAEAYLRRLRDYAVINDPHCVSTAANKLACFDRLPKEITVPWTDDKEVAERWAKEGEVVCRHSLYGHSGDGIEIVTGEVPDAPLYTKYVKKTAEFRVHAVLGEFFIQQKRGVIGAEKDYKVRNHRNGWIYSHNIHIEGWEDQQAAQAALKDIAEDARTALELSFCAADIIWNKHYQKFYILEVNTAPGLEGSTLDFYARTIGRTFL